jgi:hypothetical protein
MSCAFAAIPGTTLNINYDRSSIPSLRSASFEVTIFGVAVSTTANPSEKGNVFVMKRPCVLRALRYNKFRLYSICRWHCSHDRSDPSMTPDRYLLMYKGLGHPFLQPDRDS